MTLVIKGIGDWLDYNDMGISANFKVLLGTGLVIYVTSSAVRFIQNWRERRALIVKRTVHQQKIKKQFDDLAQKLKNGKVSELRN